MIATKPMHDQATANERLSPRATAYVIVATRALRDQLLPGMRFADPAWDILLDVFVATTRGQVLSISDVGLASRLPHTTALRWVEYLIAKRALRNVQDQNDKRRRLICLTPDYLARFELLMVNVSAAIVAANDTP